MFAIFPLDDNFRRPARAALNWHRTHKLRIRRQRFANSASYIAPIASGLILACTAKLMALFGQRSNY
jgi:hypothetical protein